MSEHDKTELEKFKSDASNDWMKQQDQRDRANEDSRFVTVPGAQWDNFLTETFDNGKRPKFQYDKLAEAVARFTGEWTTNRASIKFRPDDGREAHKDSLLLSGLLRKDMRRNNGQAAIDNAVEEAARCGFGAYRITTDWMDEEETIQKATFEPIYGAHSCVLFDSNAKRKNKSDAKRCTLIHEYSDDAFKEKWPDADPISVEHNDRRSIDFSWAGKGSVFVAERYWVEEKKEKAHKYINPATLEEELYWLDDINLVVDEMEDLGFLLISKHTIKRRRLYKQLFSGSSMLGDKIKLAGKHIPIIPLYAFWAHVDGTERYWGIIAALKDPQRLLNLLISRLAQTAASSPKETPILSPDQIDDENGVIKSMWSRASDEDLPYLLLNPIETSNGDMHQGPLGYLQRPTIDQSSAALLETTQNFLQGATGGAPQNVLDPSASGKAIMAQASRVDMNTQPIMDNIRQAISWSGEVYRWIAADIYIGKRKVIALGEDNSEFDSELMQTVTDEQTGRPVIIHDLSKGLFEVVIDTGPGYLSQRQATVDNIKEMLGSISSDSEYFAPMMAMMIDNLDGSGLDKLREFNRKIMLRLGLADAETDEEKALMKQIKDQAENQQQSSTDALVAATAEKEQSQALKYRSDAELNGVKAGEIVANTNLKKAQAINTMVQARDRRQERLYH